MYVQSLKNLHKTCFGDGDAYTDFFFSERYPAAKSYVTEREGKPVSVVYARFFELNVAGRKLEVPFFTGIATDPAYRNRHLAKELIAKACRDLENAGYPFVLLHPFNHDFYRKMGFGTANRMSRFSPAPYVAPSKGERVARPLSEADAEAAYIMYSAYTASVTASRTRSRDEFFKAFKQFLKDGGSGYLILHNGIPKAYVLIEENEVTEAVAQDCDAFDGVKECLGLRLPLHDARGDAYSMAKALDLRSLFLLLPLRGVTVNARFGYGGKTYELNIENGDFISLTEVADKGYYEVGESELIEIALGGGTRLRENPLSDVFPECNLVMFEKY